MNYPPPTFNGENAAPRKLEKFIQDAETIEVLYRIPQEDRLRFFDSLIRGEAKEIYDAARVDPNQMAMPAALPADPDDAAVTADIIARLDAHKAWLRNQYAGANQYHEIRDAIRQMYQKTDESPRSYHTRVINAYRISGYEQAVQDVLIVETWEKGLLRDIQSAINRGPTYTNPQKMTVAENTWRDLRKPANNFDFFNQHEETEEVREKPQAPVEILKPT